MKIRHWIDTGFMGLIGLVSMYAASKLEDLSKNVADLNAKLSVYMAVSNVQSDLLKDHEGRLRELEKEIKK
jgi:hypothetical protein